MLESHSLKLNKILGARKKSNTKEKLVQERKDKTPPA